MFGASYLMKIHSLIWKSLSPRLTISRWLFMVSRRLQLMGRHGAGSLLIEQPADRSARLGDV